MRSVRNLRRTAWCIAAMACLFLGVAAAQDSGDGTVKGPDLDALADAVVEAFKKSDQPEITRIARIDQVSWPVADRLCRRGEFDAAMALARAAAAVRPRDKALPAYVEKAPDLKREPGAAAAVTAASKTSKQNPRAALRALKDFKADRADVTSAGILFTRGLVYARLRKPKKAVDAYLQMAKLCESIKWPYRATVAYNFAGVTAFQAGDLKTAEACFLKQVPLAEECGDGQGAATACANLAAIHRYRGRFESAGRHLEEALRLSRKHGLRRLEKSALANLARNCLSTGKFNYGIECANAAIAIAKDGPDPENILPFATVTLGDLLAAKGDYDGGLKAIRRARAVYVRMGDEHSVALTKHSEAGVEFKRGNHRVATELWEAAIPVFRRFRSFENFAVATAALAMAKAYAGEYDEATSAMRSVFEGQMRGGDRPGAARTLQGLAGVQTMRGSFSDALATYERALAMTREMSDRVATATTLLNLANLLSMMGRREDAVERYKEILELRRGMGDTLGVADVLRDLAITRSGLNQNKEARTALEECLAIYEKNKDNTGVANTLMNLGSVEYALGNVMKGIAHIERAIGILEKSGARSELGAAYRNLGDLYAARGKFKVAASHFDRAIAEAEAAGARFILANTLSLYARWTLAEEKFDKAAKLARRGLAEIPFIVGQLGDQQGATARTEFASLYVSAAWASAKGGDAAGLCHALESGRAGILLETLGMNKALRAGAIPFELREANRNALRKESKALALHREAVAGKKLKTIRATKKELERVRAEVTDTVDRIRRDAKRGSEAFYPKLANLPEIQGALRKGETLVMYGVFDETLALVVSAAEARIVQLGPSASIRKAAAQALPEAFGSGTRGFRRKKATVTADTGQAIKKLRKRLIDPLGLDARTKRLLVSPHGVLSYVPFTLLDRDREVVYVPSGTVYLALARDRDKRGKKVLAVGDPTYRKGLERLPETAAEASAVGDVVLLRDEATKAGFLEAVSSNTRWRSVHLACHGLLNPEHPLFSSLALTPTDRSDGRLTVAELFTATIPTDLAVLSACDTGRGRIVRGEGIIGLTRAFLYAGSPRVLASLWKVNDQATRALMEKFYALWNPKDGSKGLPAATALRNAQRHVREHPKHAEWKRPFYWAAWQLWGLPD